MARQLFSTPMTFIVAAIFSAELVTQLILEVNPEGLGGWLRTLSATVISALFAVAVGIWLYNHQTSAADNKKERQLLHLLAAEMNDTKHILESDIKYYTTIEMGNGRKEKVLIAQIEPLITEEVAKSGLLDASETIAQNTYSLVRLARNIREYNYAVRGLNEAILHGTNEQVLRRIRNVNGARQLVIEFCDNVLDWLRENDISTTPPVSEHPDDTAEC